MSIVSQKVDARNEIGWTGFVRWANKWLVNSATGWILAPIWAIPEAFTTDVNDVQGQFPVVYNTDRMPYAAVSNTQYYYDNTVVGGTITTTATPISIGKGVVSEEGGYILLDINFYERIIIPVTEQIPPTTAWFSISPDIVNYTYTNNTGKPLHLYFTQHSEIQRKELWWGNSFYSHWLQFSFAPNNLQNTIYNENWRENLTINKSNSSIANVSRTSHSLWVWWVLQPWLSTTFAIHCYWQHTVGIDTTSIDNTTFFSSAYLVARTI